MATQVETNRHAAVLAQRVNDNGCRPDLKPLVATLVATLEQTLLAAQRLLGALDGVGVHQTNGAMRRVQAQRLFDPCGVVGQPACCWTDDLADPIHGPSSAPTATAGLTRREGEVLRLLAAGQSNQCIARLLCLSPRTVQRHIANLYPKVGAHNRAEATAYALRHDLG